MGSVKLARMHADNEEISSTEREKRVTTDVDTRRRDRRDRRDRRLEDEKHTSHSIYQRVRRFL